MELWNEKKKKPDGMMQCKLTRQKGQVDDDDQCQIQAFVK